MGEGRVLEALGALAHAVAEQPRVDELLANVLWHATVVLDVPDAMISLAEDGGLTPVAVSGAQARWLVGADSPVVGISERSWRTAKPVASYVAAEAPATWRAVLAVPIVSPGRDPTGALTVADAGARPWTPEEVTTLRLLGEVAASHTRTVKALDASRTRVEQLQHALDHRVEVEQAKGFLMARDGIDAGTAFERIRAQARARRVTAHRVAQEILRAGADP